MAKAIFCAILVLFLPSMFQSKDDVKSIAHSLGLDQLHPNKTMNYAQAVKTSIKRIDVQELYDEGFVQDLFKQFDQIDWNSFRDVIKEESELANLGKIVEDLINTNESDLKEVFDSIIKHIDFKRVPIKKILRSKLIIELIANRSKVDSGLVKILFTNSDFIRAVENINWTTFFRNAIIVQGNFLPNLLENMNMTLAFKSLTRQFLANKTNSNVFVNGVMSDPKTILAMLGSKQTQQSVNAANSIEKQIHAQNHTEIIRKSQLNTITNVILRQLRDPITNLSRSCNMELATLFHPLKNVSSEDLPSLLATLPVAKYLDAWGKPSAAILLGSSHWLGGYHECKSIPHAKYCYTKMHVGKQQSGSYGSCLPRGCTYDDNIKILNSLGKQLSLSFEAFPGVYCEQSRRYNSGFITTIFLCTFLFLLSLLGTFVDIVGLKSKAYTVNNAQDNHAYSDINNDEIKHIETNDKALNVQRKEGVFLGRFVSKLLLCFSMLRNNEALLSTKMPADGISSINGIRAISMMWIILGHSYVFIMYFPTDNLPTTIANIHNFSFSVVSNAYVSVDSFFLISGLLVSYLSLKRMDKSSGKLNVPAFYLHRYIRLTPPYIFVLLFFNNIFPVLVTGPSAEYYRNGEFHNKCNDYWWTNLLYINNFQPKEKVKQCVGWCWYLAVDMQLFILSPIFLFIVHYLDQRYKESRWRHYGAFLVTVIGCIAYIIINAVIVGVNDYPVLVTGHFLSDNPRLARSFEAQNNMYIKPWSRYAPYLVGLYLGYLINRRVQFSILNKKIMVAVCWIISFLISFAVVYGPYTAFKTKGKYFNMIETTAYGSMHRLAFGVSVSWIIYACHNKLAGLINNFLSWRVFIPLSRLTFGVYLLHPMVFMYFFMAFEDSVHYQNNLWAYYYISIAVFSYACAYLLALFVEYPILNLEKMAFRVKES